MTDPFGPTPIPVFQEVLESNGLHVTAEAIPSLETIRGDAEVRAPQTKNKFGITSDRENPIRLRIEQEVAT